LYLNRTLAYDAAYTPYGETYVPAGSQSDVDFTGMRPDTQTGLYDFSAREYSTVGRWISPDPSGLNAVDITNPQSWNRYAYVNNYPPTFTDPTGLCAQGAICPPSNPCAGPIPGQGGCNTSGNFPCLICGLSSWDGLNIDWHWSSEDSFYGVMIVVMPGTGAANNGTQQQNQQPSRLKDCAKAYYGFNTVSGAAQDATRIALIPAAPIIPKAAVGLPQALGSGPLTNLLSYFSLGSGTAASGANIFRVAGRIGAPIAIASAVIDATAIGICASDYQGWLPHF